MHEKSEAGFTLLETIVCIGIMMVIMGTVFVTHRNDARAKELTRNLLTRACDLARAAGTANQGEHTGTMLVIRAGTVGSSLSFLRGRPIREYDAPMADSTLAPLTTPAAISLVDPAVKDFTIAFAPDGHADVLPYALQAGAAPIPGRPGCATTAEPLRELRVTSERGTGRLWLNCNTGEISTANNP